MVTKFETVMSKLATVGQDPSNLVDCSDVIPVPPAAKVQVGHLPPGKTLDDVDSAVSHVYRRWSICSLITIFCCIR